MQPGQLAAKGKVFCRQWNYTSLHPTPAPREATPKNIKDLLTLLNSKMHMRKRNSGQKQEKSYQLNSPRRSLDQETRSQAYYQTLHLPRALGDILDSWAFAKRANLSLDLRLLYSK